MDEQLAKSPFLMMEKRYADHYRPLKHGCPSRQIFDDGVCPQIDWVRLMRQPLCRFGDETREWSGTKTAKIGTELVSKLSPSAQKCLTSLGSRTGIQYRKSALLLVSEGRNTGVVLSRVLYLFEGLSNAWRRNTSNSSWRTTV